MNFYWDEHVESEEVINAVLNGTHITCGSLLYDEYSIMKIKVIFCVGSSNFSIFRKWSQSCHVQMWELAHREDWAPKNWCFQIGAGEDSWGSIGQQGDQTSHSLRKSTLDIHLKDWCWSWSANNLATWWEELPYWKRPWFWEKLRARGEGDKRGQVGWMTSLTQWTWVWVSSRKWWRTGKPGMLQFMGSQGSGMT